MNTTPSTTSNFSDTRAPARAIGALVKLATLAMAITAGTNVHAADWSDNSVSWRAGNRFAEPFKPNDISKHILAYTHASGGQYGSDFLNIDYLMSNQDDPKTFGSDSGAKEVYLTYRHTVDLAALTGHDMKFGPIRSVGITAGIDLNSKSDSGYNSRKRMLVLGPTLSFDVPGFFNLGLHWLHESNHPSVSPGAFDPGFPDSRYTYKTHPQLAASWATPIGAWSFEGYANLIDEKGRSETGAKTATEFNIDMKLIRDIGTWFDQAPRRWRAGVEYQYWNNKFGNSDRTVGAIGGNTAKTPMLRIEYHF